MRPSEITFEPDGSPLWLRLRRLQFRVFHPFRFRCIREQCRKHRCIFVHIPKCAGSSVEVSLYGKAGGHRTLAGYHLVLDPEDFASFFKFTFVRNPWDRLVSAYCFLKNTELKGNRNWARQNLAAYDDFDAFVRGWVTPENVRSYSHFRPQHHFVRLGERRPAVDFIGYYENLAADFAVLCEKLNNTAKLGVENHNPRRARDYRSYYTDETRRIAAEVYADDVELFGYSFDNPGPTHARGADSTPPGQELFQNETACQRSDMRPPKE